jgi:hypothetical protein
VVVLQGLGALVAVPKPLEDAVRAAGSLAVLRFGLLSCGLTLAASVVLYGLVTLFSPRR